MYASGCYDPALSPAILLLDVAATENAAMEVRTCGQGTSVVGPVGEAAAAGLKLGSNSVPHNQADTLRKVPVLWGPAPCSGDSTGLNRGQQQCFSQVSPRCFGLSLPVRCVAACLLRYLPGCMQQLSGVFLQQRLVQHALLVLLHCCHWVCGSPQLPLLHCLPCILSAASPPQM